MSTIKVQDIQHTGNSNDAISLASDSSVALKYSGSSKLATSNTGVTVTGTCTATTFSGSGASLTALPAANITGTLPALSAANLTSIPAANITGTLPAIDGSNLTGISTDLVNDTSPQLGGNLDVQGNELTTTTSNGNIKATPNGSGLFEIRSSGSVDATLQLNCTVNSHGIKLKSPAHSAGQSYTFIFPDNNITADKYLKVKSISGSGATAIGQLEYASLDANDLGEGTIPDAVFPSTLPTASAANLTSIPAANITGTLPAINGAALTDLDGSNIASGTVAAARVATLNQNTTGSAATLTTARAINGVNFDGSADITVADSTKMPLAGGTFTGTIIVEDAINENVFAISDASSVALDPDNGMVQTWTIGDHRTATDSLTTGQSMLLLVQTSSSNNYTLTWPTIKWNGGSAPTLSNTDVTAIELFKVGSQLYGATVGDLS